MTTTNKFWSHLGLAMRAGKLVTGDEGVLDAVRKGEAKLVIVATDASSNTRKKFHDKCASFHTPILEFGRRDELGSSIGKAERVVVAVTDDGFANMLRKSAMPLAKPAEVE
jgi:ribosomal protein L7Ae-like RNA K-turn-binding protein